MKRILLILCTFASVSVCAQTEVDVAPQIATQASQQALAEKTGNSHDVITNFYQVALKNIFSKNGELSISSTIFGLLDSANQKMESPVLFDRYKWARNLQVNAHAKLNSDNNKINSVGGGFVFAVLNRRDITAKDHLFDDLDSLDNVVNDYKSRAATLVTKHIKAYFYNNEKIKNKKERESLFLDSSGKKNDIIEASLEKYNESYNEKELDNDFKAALRELNAYENFIHPAKLDDSLLKSFVKRIARRPLWTIGTQYEHRFEKSLDTVTINSDFVVGIGNIEKRLWEINASGYLKNYRQDTADNRGSALHLEAGLNKVLMVDKDGNSKMELKVFSSFDKILTDGSDPVFAANLTYRACVYKEFWVPITIKYDPEHGNLFGFISLALNIDKYKPASAKDKD